MRILYKLLLEAEWSQFERDGLFDGSEVDLKDGFIHFSYADQLNETARKHFSGKENLVLLAVSPVGMGEQLRDEISRGGVLFPHLYKSISVESLLWTRKILLGEDQVPVIGVVPDGL